MIAPRTLVRLAPVTVSLWHFGVKLSHFAGLDTKMMLQHRTDCYYTMSGGGYSRGTLSSGRGEGRNFIEVTVVVGFQEVCKGGRASVREHEHGWA